MDLQVRIVVLPLRVLLNGNIQKWTRADIYDADITPSPEIPATYNDDKTIKTPAVAGVSDLYTAGREHCETILREDENPADVQAMLDKTKAKTIK